MFKAATLEEPVFIVGVWHALQPMDENSALPRAMEAAPPGVSVEGAGGARKRMKFANCTTSLAAATGVAASVLVVSLGVPLN